MSDGYFKEIFEYPIQEFKEHLERSTNERIIFSGKYGIGKTRFLENVFQKGNQEKVFGSDKYNIFRVSPVNYSISSNEDIIRYIKYDIILELLKKSTSMDQVDLSYLKTLPQFIVNNLHKVAAAMIYMVPKIGKDVVTAFEKIDKLKEEFFKYHDESNKSSGDKMIEYLEELEAKEGSLYENDIITRIISDTIEKDDSKQAVLIVDDVDRIDPEHLFRILNVFAAHFDTSNEKKNKFNFDKVIIVCDFNNIRTIFHHRYGNEADFMGYIDKFYSSDIYYFDNKKAIIGILNKIFESIQFEIKEGENENVLRQLYFRDDFVLTLGTLMIERNFINLINVIKLRGKLIKYHHEKIQFPNKSAEVYAWWSPIMMELRLLKDFLGDYRNMKKILSECSRNNEYIHNFEFHFGKLISVLGATEHNFFRDEIFRFKFREADLVVQTKSNRNSGIDWVNLYKYMGTQNNTFITSERFNVTLQGFWEALLDTCELLHKAGFLR